MASPSVSANTVIQPRNRSYYDIILVGRTGQGKSSLGNKLLQFTTFEQKRSWQETASSSPPPFYFRTADSVDDNQKMFAVTKQCDLLTNETTMVRVLDTPGLSNANDVSAGIFSTNRQIFRGIVFNQLMHKIAAKRLLYFLPVRGVPCKADGAMQEELKVMYHFFGPAVFDHMVLVATQDKEYQQYKFSDEQCGNIKKVLDAAIVTVTNNKCTSTPPVIYIGISDSEEVVLAKIKSAPVLAGSESAFMPSVQNEVCARCSCQIHYVNPIGTRIPVGIVREDDGDLVEYDESNCHPRFVPRYNSLEKIAGGIVHIVTLGIPFVISRAIGSTTWPGFTNSSEICPNCKQSPGLPPCYPISEEYEGTKVTHSNELDQN